MVALINVGFVGIPANGHDLEAANIAQNISFVAGASPATETGVIGTVEIGRDGYPVGRVGGYPTVYVGNSAEISGLTPGLIGIIDSFVVKWNGSNGTNEYHLDATAFENITTLQQLTTLIDAVDGTGSGGLIARIDFLGRLQITLPLFSTFNELLLMSSTGLPALKTAVAITGITDAEAGAVDAFTITISGTPLDTAGVDFGAISNRAELAAALDALHGIEVTESADDERIIITAETPGPKTFTGISLADLTPNPAIATFGAATLAALDAQVAAAESFALVLNGVPLDLSALDLSALDLSALDFTAIDTAAELVAALDAIDSISAQLVGAAIAIRSDALGPGNAFSGLALIDNEGAPPARARIDIAEVNDWAFEARAFALSIDGVPVDTAVVDFAAVTDGASLAAELDKIAGIDVAYSTENVGTLIITASTIGPAVFSGVSLTRPNLLRGDPVASDIIGAFPAGTLILGLGGDDHLTGQGGDDRLEGGEGHDTLIGNGGPDELIGDNGNDQLFGGAGDTLEGGDGDDLIVIDAPPASLSGGAGDDTVRIMATMLVPDALDVEFYEIAGFVRADFFGASRGVVVRATTMLDPHVIGSAHDDQMTGHDGNDTFEAGEGDDTFTGGRQNDDITGGGGTDTAVFTGTRAQYRVERLGNGDIRLSDLRAGLPDGMDTVRQVERFVFSDGTFDATSVLNDPPTGGVAVLGSVTEDQTITIDTTALADEDGLGPLHYQWQRNAGAGFVNVGADQASYALGDADVGAIVRVVVSYTDLNGSPEQVSAVTAAVANINDAPAITAHGGGIDAGIALFENTTGVTTVTAFDLDGPALSYAIAGGDDAGQFRIDAATGALSFVAAPDFESPSDSGRDNTYVVTVRVSDGSAFDDQTILVAVGDASEAPPVTVLTGTPGDDSFTAPVGSAQIAGLGGNDSVTFGFALTEATISFHDGEIVVDSGASHTVLTGVERFIFTDGSVRNDDNPPVDDLFYYSRYHDVWTAQADADAHYAAFGWQEGRDPNAFASSFLTEQVVDGFDFVYYLRHNPDVAAAGVDPYTHFQTFGWREGRDPNALFDTAGYLAAYQDVATNPLDHYNSFGWQEGRDPSAGFDTTSYLSAYPDVAAAGVNPLSHYLTFGVHEGRSPFADGMWG